MGDSFRLEPDDFQMVFLGEKGVENHPSDQDWLEYGGRWGDWARLADISKGAAGPRGPGHGENEEKWSDPVSWGNRAFAVSPLWFNLSWVAYNFLYIFAGIILALSVVKIWKIAKQKKQKRLNLVKILRSKAGVGIFLGVTGVILYSIGILLPWYIVRGNIQTVALQTVGEVDLVLIDGVNGLRVNMLQSDQGLAQLFGLGIPFGIILLSSVVLNVLDLIGVEKPKSLSRSYIISAFTSLIPVIIILIFVIQLASIVAPFASVMGGGENIPPQVDAMARELSSSPVTGNYSSALNGYGNLYVSWGLGIGSYLFIVAAITKLAAGMVVRKAVVEKPKEETEPTKEEKPSS